MNKADLTEVQSLLSTLEDLEYRYEQLKNIEAKNRQVTVNFSNGGIGWNDITRHFSVSDDPFFRRILHREQESTWSDIVLVRMKLRELGMEL